MDEILTVGVVNLIFGVLALSIGYLYTLPRNDTSTAPFALIIEQSQPR